MDALMKAPKVMVQIPLDYNTKGAKRIVVSGPLDGEMEFGAKPVEYSLGIFLTNGYTQPEEVPDIEIRLRFTDVMTLKNALAAIQIAAGQ